MAMARSLPTTIFRGVGRFISARVVPSPDTIATEPAKPLVSDQQWLGTVLAWVTPFSLYVLVG